MMPSPYQHHLKLVGDGRYALTLKSRGFLEGLETVDFGPGDRHQFARGTRDLYVEVQPRKAGKPRELVFSVRPLGAPVWVSGTRDGRPLQPRDVFMAREGIHPR